MALALLIPILAGGVAAQVTLPFINYDEVVKAVNPTDRGYQICTAAAEFVSSCVDGAGGTEGLSTANPVSFAACACCIGTTDVAPVYSTCADYLGSEAPQLGSQISAYDYLYSVCGSSPQLCLGGQAGGSATVTDESEPSSTAQSSQFQSHTQAGSTSTPSPASSPSKVPEETSRATEGGSTTGPTKASATGGSGSASGSSPGSAVTTLAGACTLMVEVFEECTRATPGFTDLVYGEQAYCYCCRTALDGQVTWTDEIDTYASTCRDWAATITTGEPVTAYDVAKTFATFCEHFSDACSVTTTAPASEPTNTNNSPFPPPDATGNSGDSSTGGGGGGGQVTVTVTQPPATTTNAAPIVRVGFAAGAIAVAGLVVMI